MHIPDGFLDTKTAISTAALSAIGLGVALRHLRRDFPRSRVPLIGLSAAFIFAAQMLNFPVMGGTSGHLIGAVLVAVLLGPHAAVLVMSSVLILQCLLFADGGVTALGANIFNMAILAPGIGYVIYRSVSRWSGSNMRGRLLAAGFAAWCSTVAAAITCAGQLAFSGIVSWNVVFPAMTDVHMLIGLGEAFITVLVVYALSQSHAGLFDSESQLALRPRPRGLIAYGVLISAGLAIFIAPAASSWPDGLERVAANLGFEHHAITQPLILSPLPDYAIPGIHSAVASTMLAGLIGLVVVFCLAYALARRLTPSESTR
jgi:cobalt/nickel transport system permease protein